MLHPRWMTAERRPNKKPEINKLSPKKELLNLTDEQIDTFLEQLTVDFPIYMPRFLWEYLRRYDELCGKISPPQLSGAFMLDYAISKVPETAKNFEEVYPIITDLFVGNYDQKMVHYCLGSGWYPPYPYPVSVRPFYFPVSHRYDLKCVYPDAALNWYTKTHAFKHETGELCCFSILLSDKDNVTPSQMEQFWASLYEVKEPVIFEIVGNGTYNVSDLVKEKVDFETLILTSPPSVC